DVQLFFGGIACRRVRHDRIESCFTPRRRSSGCPPPARRAPRGLRADPAGLWTLRKVCIRSCTALRLQTRGHTAAAVPRAMREAPRMRLFFISKRHPQQRDLLERPYGRFHHLPRLLAARGHEVEVALCSHRGLPGSTVWSEGVRWIAMDIRTAGLQ